MSTETVKIKAMEKASVTFMEPMADGINWQEKTVIKNLWKCLECGLVWQMEHEARNCESRKHIPQYIRYYGGWSENGVRVGGTAITFYARRWEKPTE